MSVYDAATRTAAQLTAQARAAAQVASTGFSLSTYLPDHDNFGLTFDFALNSVPVNDAASYRAFNTSADLGRTEGSGSRSGKLPPISRKYIVDEYTQLKLYGQNDALGGIFENYARRVGLAIATRVELARGQGIETGTVVINERDLHFTIDYGRKAEHTVAAATLWDNGGDPIDDFGTWDAVYAATNGGKPAVRLVSSRLLQALATNEAIIAAAFPNAANLPTRISQTDVLSVLAAYGYTGITEFDETAGGQRVVSDNKVIYLPAPSAVAQLGEGSLGTTEWGIPAESTNATYGISDSEKPGIFAGAFAKTDPESREVLGSAIVLPAISNANATFTATVLS